MSAKLNVISKEQFAKVIVNPPCYRKYQIKIRQTRTSGDKLYSKLFHGLSASQKRKYLQFDYVQEFIGGLNQIKKRLGDDLVKFFLTAEKPSHWVEMYNLILEKGGFIGPILSKNPGSAQFMDLLYRYKEPQGPLDSFLTNCLSGQAVNYRKKAVVQHSMDLMKNGKERILLNLGSGYGYDSIEIAKKFQKMRIINVEIDREVVERGEQILNQLENNFQNISFLCKDMARVKIEQQADYAWVIGVLCSFTQECSIKYLSLFRRRYMLPQGIIWGACVSDQMVKKDLFTSFVLEKILNWHLYYRTKQDVKEIFEKAGYKWREDLVFSESERGFYIIGAGEA